MSLAIADGGIQSSSVNASNGNGAPPPEIAGRDLVQRATDPKTGTVDTVRLGQWVVDAAKTSPQAASQAFEAIENHLGAGDLSRFQTDTTAAFKANQGADQKNDTTYSATTPGFAAKAAGSKILRSNPILEIQWRSTVSPITNKSGFSKPLQKILDDAGIKTGFRVNPRPAGGTTVNTPASKTLNGSAARDAIANDLRTDPAYSAVQNEKDGLIVRQTSLGERHVDVSTIRTGPRPEENVRVDIESKLGRASRTTGTNGTVDQVAKDAERLAENTKIRGLGSTLETVGKVAKPVGIAVDAVQLGAAFHADGNKIGDHTEHAAGSIAGGAGGAWAGAEGGALIGTAIGGPVGTVVGGLVGGAVGGIAGSKVGEKAVDWVKSWF